MLNIGVRRVGALAAASLLAAGALGALAGCGDDDEGAGGSTATAPTSDYVEVPMSEVLAGIPELLEHAGAAASAGNGGDYTTAQAELEALLEVWFRIEGTIKATDPEMYRRFETAQSLIHNGAETDNAERIQIGADDQEAVADEFVAAYGS